MKKAVKAEIFVFVLFLIFHHFAGSVSAIGSNKKFESNSCDIIEEWDALSVFVKMYYHHKLFDCTCKVGAIFSCSYSAYFDPETIDEDLFLNVVVSCTLKKYFDILAG